MSTSVVLKESRSGWEHPQTTPLDEAAWGAWLLKGVALDKRNSLARMTAVKWVSIVVLVAASGLWTYVTPYDIVVRFIMAAGATVVMFQAFQDRRYAFAAGFGTLALVYNPLFPVFNFLGDWQRALVATSAVPFAASLTWRNVKAVENG